MPGPTRGCTTRGSSTFTKRGLPGRLRLGIIHDLTIPEVPPYLTVDNVDRRRFGAEPGTPEALRVVVYGDTHVQRMDLIGATLCINPGSPTYPHNLETQLGTIGFLELGAEGVRASICQLTEAGHETVAVTEAPRRPGPLRQAAGPERGPNTASPEHGP